VVGDVIFIMLAIYGLSILADLMGNYFILIKYLGGIYLIGLGVVLFIPMLKLNEATRNVQSSLSSSFVAGLLITLGDQKAILFYFSFFPAFVDLSTITLIDTSIIVVIASITIIGAKFFYVFFANKSSSIIKNTKVQKVINIVAANVMIAIGIILIVKTY